MLIRLLQNFRSFTFLPECAPREFRTPVEWEGLPGRKGVDKFYPKRNLTMHSGVGFLFLVTVVVEYLANSTSVLCSREVCGLERRRLPKMSRCELYYGDTSLPPLLEGRSNRVYRI